MIYVVIDTNVLVSALLNINTGMYWLEKNSNFLLKKLRPF